MGNGSYQLTSAGRSANHGQIGRHWLAGNSHFPHGRIFIFCFSEPLGINSKILNSLLLGRGLFIQIQFGGLCTAWAFDNVQLIWSFVRLGFGILSNLFCWGLLIIKLLMYLFLSTSKSLSHTRRNESDFKQICVEN